MKYLSEYMEAKQSALFKENGAFFAFGNNQLQEGKERNVARGYPLDTKLVDLGGGLICPCINAKTVVEGVDKIYADAIIQDLKENTKSGVIKRELYNHECFYTGDYSNVIDILSDYNITVDEIKTEFFKELPNSDC